MADKDPADGLVYKLIASALSLGAGWLANKAVQSAWRRATGHDPYRSMDDDDATLAGVVAFAAVSAGAAALSQAIIANQSRKLATRVATINQK